MDKLKIKDKELIAGSEELQSQIKKKLGADYVSGDEEMGGEDGDEDWEDESEEDISGDEEEMMKD